MLLRSSTFSEAVVGGFMEADVNMRGRLMVDEFAPIAAAAVHAHLDERIRVSTLAKLFDAFDADCDGGPPGTRVDPRCGSPAWP